MTKRIAYTPAELLGSLNEIESRYAPKELFVRGDVSLLARGPRVSIVGSREASANALRRTRKLAHELVKRDAIVVSGLARGIDGAAHRAAIEAGGRTIAVIGSGIDIAYPREHADLQREIEREHLLVTQFRPGTPPRGGNFPQRNRTMALLSDATVVVAATEESGTKHQAFEALRLGRLLFLVDDVAENEELSWPSEVIAYGAQVLSRENFGYVVQHIPHLTTVDAQIPA